MSRSERLARMKAEQTSDPQEFARWVRDELDDFLGVVRKSEPREAGYHPVAVETSGGLVRLRVGPPAAESVVEPASREAFFVRHQPEFQDGDALVYLAGDGWPRSRYDAMCVSSEVIGLASSALHVSRRIE